MGAMATTAQWTAYVGDDNPTVYDPGQPLETLVYLIAEEDLLG